MEQLSSLDGGFLAVEDPVPVAPIGGRVRITVAIWSYCDCLYFGITGDRDTAPDIERLGHGIARGFAGLLEAAQPG